MENQSFGILLSFSISDFDLEATKIIESFQKADIDQKFWPTERKPKKAFQKALKEAIEGDTGFMVRSVEMSKNVVTAGLVLESKDTLQRDLKYDVRNVLTLNSENETIEGKTDFRTNAITESYKDYRQKLGGLEILFKMKEMLFHSMAIEVLCRKSYFIPAKFVSNVKKFDVLFDALSELGAGVQLEYIGVDSSTETRNNIVGHFRSQTIEALDKEILFCIKQREKFQNGTVKYLRETAFRHLLAKIKVLEERLKTYIQLLEMTPDEDKMIWEKMAQLDEEINTNIELSQKNKKFSKKDAMANL